MGNLLRNLRDKALDKHWSPLSVGIAASFVSFLPFGIVSKITDPNVTGPYWAVGALLAGVATMLAVDIFAANIEEHKDTVSNWLKRHGFKHPVKLSRSRQLKIDTPSVRMDQTDKRLLDKLFGNGIDTASRRRRFQPWSVMIGLGSHDDRFGEPRWLVRQTS